jgi:regulator of RNase E activity RraB
MGGSLMEWYMNINEEARVAYLLCLTEKIINQVAEGKNDVRNAINMCWEWVEEKKYHADDIYEVFVNDEAQGVAMYYEFTEDPQQEVIWLCFNYAMEYTIWQAYEYEDAEAVPQPIEIVDDEMIEDFTQEIKKVNGYQEEWAERLKEYLLENYPAGSDRKIKREELLRLVA